MSKTIASVALLLATFIGIVGLLELNERWAGPSSQELIDQLVTTNPRPHGAWSEVHLRDWNRHEEARVLRVWRQLETDPREHMTALIANVERPEFSTTIATSVPYYSLSVGHICGSIIEGHFYRHAYQAGLAKPEPKTSPPNYFARPRSELVQWWESHRHHSDQEIGILIKEWHHRQTAAASPPVR